jgi:hypothetical protein
MSRDHLQEVQGTNEHAAMLASRQHIKLFRDGQKSVYFACKGSVIGAEAREPVSNGQICIWAKDVQMVPSPFSRWSAPLNTAITPEFLAKSAHIYGELFRLWDPRDCPKSELLSLHLLHIAFFFFKFELKPENQPCSSGNHQSSVSPDGRRFHFVLCTPHFKLLVENRPEISEKQAVQNHLLTLHTVWCPEYGHAWSHRP